MSIRIPGNGPQPLFPARPAFEPDPEERDPDLATMELTHKADKALADFLKQARGPAAGKGRDARPPDADFLRSVMSDAPDETIRRSVGGHLAASMESFALEHAALRAGERATRREEALQRRSGDVAGHISRLTEILTAGPHPELRKTAAKAVAGQLHSLTAARRAVRGSGGVAATTER